MDILIFAGVVMALTEVVKQVTAIKNRFVPIVSLLIGVLLFTIAVLTGAATFSYALMIDALVSVLTAMGLYSGVKNTAGL